MRDSDEDRNLRGRQLLELEQNEDGTQVEIHGVEHAIEKGPRPLLIDELIGPIRRDLVVAGVGMGHFATKGSAAPKIGHHTQRRSEEKAALATDGNRVDAARRDDEDLLRRVVGLIGTQPETTQRSPKKIEVFVENPAKARVSVGADGRRSRLGHGGCTSEHGGEHARG